MAEPNSFRRERFTKIHSIPPLMCFNSWSNLFEKGKISDIAIICSSDKEHAEPTIAALDLAYDVLLEKPIANTLNDCIKIIEKVKKTNRILGVGHVLRYTEFFKKIHHPYYEPNREERNE